MASFQKKPVVIEAEQWHGEMTRELVKLLKRSDDYRVVGPQREDGSLPLWNTEEGQWIACPLGHWIIKGIKGEVYPCSPDVFEATYEPTTEPRHD